jgi:hypothetical protein
MKTKTLVRYLTIAFILYTFYRAWKDARDLEEQAKKPAPKQEILIVEVQKACEPVVNPVPVTEVQSTLPLKILAAYSVKAVDSNRILWVTNPVALTFNENGQYNVVVRANPVPVLSGTNLVQTLEAGVYLIEVLNGTVTII